MMMTGRIRRLKRRTGDSAPASLSRWAARMVSKRAKSLATGSTLIGSETLKPPSLIKILNLPEDLKKQSIPPTVGSPLTQVTSKPTLPKDWKLEPLLAQVTLSSPTLLRPREMH